MLSGGGPAEILRRSGDCYCYVINYQLLLSLSHLRAVSSEVVISPGGHLLGLAGCGTEAGGVGHPHHPSHVGRGQPTLLVVVASRQLPAFVLTILL